MGKDLELLLSHDPACWWCFYCEEERKEKCIRIIGENEWAQFSLVPKIPGQKYIIGHTYKLEGWDGEFIFCPCKEAGQNHCEIICGDEGLFWLNPLGKKNRGCWINGKRVEKKQRLEFGDLLAFGTQRNVDLEAPKISVEFLLRERQFRDMPTNLKTNKKENVQNIQENCTAFPGEIHLIMSKIISFLTHSDLKSFRLVCKLWNREASEVLRKKSVAKFEALRGYTFAQESMTLFRYTSEMTNMQLPHLDMRFSTISWKNGKLLDDLNTFISNEHCPVKKLSLKLHTASQEDYKLQMKVLNKFSQLLEELEFSIRWEMIDDSFIPEIINFPALKSLELFVGVQKDCVTGQRWANTFFESVKSVGTLHLVNIEQNEWVLGQIPKFFHNLENIELDITDPDVIRTMLELRKPLKVLKFGIMPNLKDDMSNFSQLLSYHAESLESLQFVLPPLYNEDDAVVLRLPSFKCLKHLEIYFELNKGMEKIVFEFPNQTIIVDYRKYFPSLRSLAVWPYYGFEKMRENVDANDFWEEHQDQGFMAQFFPTISYPICESVKLLDIPHKQMHQDDDDDKIFQELEYKFNRKSQLCIAFPNVVNWD